MHCCSQLFHPFAFRVRFFGSLGTRNCETGLFRVRPPNSECAGPRPWIPLDFLLEIVSRRHPCAAMDARPSEHTAP